MEVSVLSVATSGYLSHWKQMFASAERYFFPNHQLTMHLFTDEVALAKEIQVSSERVQVKVHEVPSWGWPDATLFRFRAISEHARQITGDLTCWLDADMLVLRETGDELTPKSWVNGLAFVRHPGYWRPTGSAQIRTWLKQPRVLANDIVRNLTGKKPLGAWEENEESRAYVPAEQRLDYICGGAWFGWTDRVMQMAKVLALRTDEDLFNDIVARWHDESHINWYLAHNAATLLGPEYCYERTYAHLQVIRPRIEAVDKGTELSKSRQQVNRVSS